MYLKDAAASCIYRTEWTVVAWPRRSPLKDAGAPMAIRRAVGFDVFNARFLIGLDKLLRAKRRYQGDLSASINDALLAVNLNKIKLVTLQGKKKRTARETQVVLQGQLIRRIKGIADARGCSINQLVNSGLLAYYSKERTGNIDSASRVAPRAFMSAYDKMSASKRQQLMERLESYRFARTLERPVSGRHQKLTLVVIAGPLGTRAEKEQTALRPAP
jgi:hypothetical protein